MVRIGEAPWQGEEHAISEQPSQNLDAHIEQSVALVAILARSAQVLRSDHEEEEERAPDDNEQEMKNRDARPNRE